MSDYTTTPNHSFYLPVVDADEGAWGTHINSNTTALDTLLSTTGVTATGTFLPLRGGTMNGMLTLFSNPSGNMDAATKSYVDNAAPLGGPYLPQSGGTVTGPMSVNSTLSQTGTRAWTGTTFPGTGNLGWYQSLTYTGSPTAGVTGPEGQTLALNLINPSESLTYTSGQVSALEVYHQTTGGTGPRSGIQVTHELDGALNPGSTYPGVLAGSFFQKTMTNIAGAASGAGNGLGDQFGLYVNVQTNSGVWLHSQIGMEIDLGPPSGGTVDYQIGMQIVNFGVAGNIGQMFDAMLVLATSDPSTNKRSTYGLYFGSPQAPANGFPITAAGTMIGSPAGNASIGIDFSACTFSGAFLKGPNGFQVDNNNTVHSDVIVPVTAQRLAVNDLSGNPILVLTGGRTAQVGYIQIAQGDSGGSPFILANGATGSGMGFMVVSGGNFAFVDVNNYPQFQVVPVASTASWLIATAAASGNPVTLSVGGPATPMKLTAPTVILDGAVTTTGNVSVGAYAITPNGYGYLWTDSGGDHVLFNLQGDNNLVLTGTNASGGGRPIANMAQRSATSTWTWDVPVSMSNGLGAFGATPVTARPTVTGAKGGNAALTSLMTALSAYGLVTDSTS